MLVSVVFHISRLTRPCKTFRPQCPQHTESGTYAIDPAPHSILSYELTTRITSTAWAGLNLSDAMTMATYIHNVRAFPLAAFR